jgi:lysophospholipase L1-like esterase
VNPAGAVNHMSIPSAGEPEQISALSSATSLVTVTIGANNLNLGGIFTNCYSKLTFPAIDDCFTSSLSDDFINNTIPYVLENTTDYGPSLDDTYTAIRNAAPNATIVVPTYAQVFPAVSPGDASCNTIPQTMVSQANLTRIRRVVSAINVEVKAAAARHGFTVIDEENSLAGHEECEPNSWVNPLNALGADDEDLHPTVAGYAKEAADLKAYLDAIA